MNDGTMVGIQYIPTKNMCHVADKWLKTVNFGTNCNFQGTNFTLTDVWNQGR
jgi:hypothetical protein